MSRKREQKKENKANIEPSGVIIYDPVVDPNGENAFKAYKEKYPDYDGSDGVVVILPDNGRDGMLLNDDGSKKAYIFI